MSEDGHTTPESDLAGLIYGTTIDSALWVRLLSEVFSLNQTCADAGMVDADPNSMPNRTFETTLFHISQASAIAEKMLDYREAGQFLEQSLASLSCGLAFFDDFGDSLWSNHEMLALLDASGSGTDISTTKLTNVETDETLSIRALVQSYKFSDKPIFLRLAKDTARPEIVFLPRQQAEKYGLPARAAAALIHVDPFRSDALNELAAKHDLTKREAALVEQILRHSDLRQAGDAIGVSYETARSYLKRIFEKVGCSTQAELVARVISSPSSLLRKAPPTDPNKQIRQIIRLSSGRNMEAFVLGPKTGFVVVCFASNIEAVLDVLNETETYQRILEQLGVRIVMPQWPGAYRSDPTGEDYDQGAFASDVVEIVSQLGAKKFSILSTGFSTDEALRIAHDFPDKVQKVILASAHNSTVADTQQQHSDPLFALTNLLVKKSHRLGTALLGLMWRQIAQDPSKKAKSIVRSSDCKADKDLFMSAQMAAREQKLLALRFAQGFKGQIHRATVRIRPRSFRLDQIETPVEIFQSDNERVTPLDNARALANDLKNCEFHILHDAGHAHIYRNWPWLVARAAGANILPGAITASYPIDLTGKSAPLKIETSQPPTR